MMMMIGLIDPHTDTLASLKQPTTALSANILGMKKTFKNRWERKLITCPPATQRYQHMVSFIHTYIHVSGSYVIISYYCL